MVWDDDKSTASDPDNPAADEQLTADEWDNHVSDQIGRLEYGPLSSRPPASEKPQGALWFDEHGRISRVDSNNNWVVESLGSDTQGIPTLNGRKIEATARNLAPVTPYTSGPAHGEGGSAFQGATTAPDGRVVLAPLNSDNVGIVDTSGASVTYTSGPAHGEGGSAFQGATTAPDGRVVFAPLNSDNVGIVDTSGGSVTYTSGPAHGEGSDAFFGATTAPDGRVVFAPSASDNIGVVSIVEPWARINSF